MGKPEYHTKFEELEETHTFKGHQWFGKRQDLVGEYSWAIPNEQVITYLAEFDELIEVGAGNGYWAYEIEQNGGNTQSYDIDPPENTWSDVIKEDVKNLKQTIGNNPLLMVWPPVNNSMAYTAARCEPSHICYIGEPRGGCTANSEFFDIIEEKYGLAAMIDIPSYVGINDNFFHYVRKQ